MATLAFLHHGGLPDSGEKVKVVKYIPNVDKLLLAAGLKFSIEIDDYSYFFKSWTITGLRTRILHHVMHSLSSKKVLKNTVKRKFSKKKKLYPKIRIGNSGNNGSNTKKYFAGFHDTSNIRCI
jgi:hypothetical protein